MPKGVEHQEIFRDFSISEQVRLYQMPKGVEH